MEGYGKDIPIRRFGRLSVHACTEQQLFDTIRRTVEAGAPLRITYTNAHNVNVAEHNEAYRNALAAFDIVFPEGEGMAIAARILKYPNHEKFHTTDFWERLFPLFREHNKKLFLLGSKKKTLAIARKMFSRDEIDVCGFADGYEEVTNTEALFLNIKSNTPDVLLIGMGVPKQELWVAEHYKHLDVPLIICVGNFIEFYAGTLPRAPRFLRVSGFEWLHRLFTEPRRLWKRYILGIPKFLGIVLKQRKKKL